jgi:hypothetical protein
MRLRLKIFLGKCLDDLFVIGITTVKELLGEWLQMGPIPFPRALPSPERNKNRQIDSLSSV